MDLDRRPHAASTFPSEWVVVAGGVHARGGMEKANAALVDYLLAQGATVHIVTHEIAPDRAVCDRVRVHIVPKVFGLALTDLLLAREGRRVARAVVAASPGARVVTNGGNCPWPDVNWVHYVHHAWKGQSSGPLPHRVKDRALNVLGRRTERDALRAARLVIVNSERTRRDVIEHLGVPESRVRLIYLGAESAWRPPSAVERDRARQQFEATPDERVIAFVGGLGHDERKGFDVLLAAWQILDGDATFRGRLLVAGGGRRLSRYASQALGCTRNPIVFLGHTSAVPEVLAAADLTVSPSRYEPYGLNVQESLMRGVPAIATRTSGIAERFTPALEPLLLTGAGDINALVATIRRWDGDREAFRVAARALGDELRKYTWADMSCAFVSAVLSHEGGFARAGSGTRA